jgi:preprotein translocase subunit YajC
MNLLFIQNEGAEPMVVEAVDATVETPVAEDAVAVEETVTEVGVAEEVVPEQPEPTFLQEYGMWFLILGMIAIMYFFMWRPESKRRKQMQQFRDGLKKGDKIITAGGIYGVIKEVHETSLLIEVDSNVTLRIDKNMVVGDPTQGVMQK